MKIILLLSIFLLFSSLVFAQDNIRTLLPDCSTICNDVDGCMCPVGCVAQAATNPNIRQGLKCEDIKCIDTDGGKNYYIKGEASGWSSVCYVPLEQCTNPSFEESIQKDRCVDANGRIIFESDRLAEGYCAGVLAPFEFYTCPNGCKDGACIQLVNEKKEIDSSCSADSECKTNYCAFNYELNKNTCQLKSHGRECNPTNVVNECYGKCLTVKGNVVGEGKSFCCPSDRNCVESNGNCRFEGMASTITSSMICKNGIWVKEVQEEPSVGNGELGSLCTTNSECKTNYCAFNYELNKNTCQLKSHGRECNSNNEINECYGKCLTVKGNVPGIGNSFCCASDKSCVDGDGNCRSEGSKAIEGMICKNGIWVKELQEESISSAPEEEKEKIVMPAPSKGEEVGVCDGCLYLNKCVPYTLRIENKFCDIDKEIKLQFEEGMYCNNNYECTTNLCINNECIGRGFLEKLFAWFKKIFG